VQNRASWWRKGSCRLPPDPELETRSRDPRIDEEVPFLGGGWALSNIGAFIERV
jgi:hypothetical protein